MREILIDEAFGPSPRYRGLLWQYLALFVLLAVCPWVIPVILFAPVPLAKVIVAAVALAIVLPLVYWVPRYYDSISSTVGSKHRHRAGSALPQDWRRVP